MNKVEIVLRQTQQGAVSETVLASFENSETVLAARPTSESMTFPGLVILLNERLVYRNDTMILLTHKEYCTLVFLAKHLNWTYSANQIYEAVWLRNGGYCGNAVSKVIGHLRHKLTPDTPRSGYIQTVVGHGYKFKIPEQLPD